MNLNSDILAVWIWLVKIHKGSITNRMPLYRLLEKVEDVWQSSEILV